MKIKIPFLDNTVIWKRADDFRMSLAHENCDSPPIDTLYVVDIILRLDIIELPDLFRQEYYGREPVDVGVPESSLLCML